MPLRCLNESVADFYFDLKSRIYFFAAVATAAAAFDSPRLVLLYACILNISCIYKCIIYICIYIFNLIHKNYALPTAQA